MRNSFIFYKSFYDSIKELGIEDQAQIYNAIFEYEFNGKEVELNGVCKSIFALIIPLIKANDKRYENGCKGGRPKNQNETKLKPKNNQNETKLKPNELCIINYELCNMNNNNKKNKQKKFFENDELNCLFLEYLDLRTKLKCKNTDRAITLLLNKLNDYDDTTKKEMLNNAIMNSWKSVYPIKEFKTNKKEDNFNKVLEEVYNGTIQFK